MAHCCKVISMAKKEEAPAFPSQSEETRENVLNHAPQGDGTATGVALQDLRGEHDERLKDLPGGSEQPIEGGDQIKPDYPPMKAAKPVGMQAEPAIYTSNGTLPVGHVPSPSGLVPAAAQGLTGKAAVDAVDNSLKSLADHAGRISSNTPLSDSKIESISAAELRAIGHTRGYDLGEYAGARTTRRRFREAQKNDKGLDKPKKGE
jgi:hypothetical protein